MKNLLKFFVFVALLSLGISALYDYRMKHGGLGVAGQPRSTPEKYTLATSPNVDPKQVASLEALNRERRALVSAVIPSVVAVKTTKKIATERQNQLDPFGFFFRRPRGFQSPNEDAMVQNSLGSGVIVTNEGHIITNNHVVDQVDEIEVQLADGRTEKARLIGADDQVDLAVLKIDNPNVKPLPLADSDSVQAGDFVLAIGNPFGFEETVTDGIVSSKGRPNRADIFGDLIQTNAAINPGNSGGPLVNLRGEVIGINTAIISRSGGSQGIGFAIPSNTVRTALESLLKKGRIIRGYLGIQMRVPQNGQPVSSGEVVVDEIVPGSPADDAHLQKGDVIRKFDGHDVKSFSDLRNLVSQVDLNKKVELEIMRAGKSMTVSTQIKEQPAGYQTGRVTPQQPQQPRPPKQQTPGDEEENTNENALAGIHVGELTPALARQLDLPNGVRGVVVTDVDRAAGLGDLQKGDVIEEVNQQPVATVADYNKIVQTLDSSQPMVLSVCRHRVRSFLVLRPR
ncbi:MAG TPA: Do family serine endopeptidase [Chthoniobacterales bacterium]|jgi:serine protease Do|nr:Do family serine endopeptidase [Chthoniobacterales bacterium]